MNERKRSSSLSGGVFLIGLGILAYTNWWWPGILLVVGVASSAELIHHRKYSSALITLGLFSAIPILIQSNIPWQFIGPFILIAIGAAVIIRNLSRPADEAQSPAEASQ